MLYKAWLLCLVICLFLAACSREGDINKRGKEEISLTLTAPATTLSDCLANLSVESGNTDIKNGGFTYYWKINGEWDDSVNSRKYLFTQTVENPTPYEVTVSIESEEYYGTVTSIIEVLPTAFKSPLESNLVFSETPVLSRGDSMTIDPGAVIYHDDQFHGFVNISYDDPHLVVDPVSFGYAVSDDGISREGVAIEPENLLMTIDDIAAQIDFKPRNIQVKSVLFEDGVYTIYFTVAKSLRNFFLWEYLQGRYNRYFRSMEFRFRTGPGC